MNYKNHKNFKVDVDFSKLAKVQSVYDLLSNSLRGETANWFNKAFCLMIGVKNDDTNYLFNLENIEDYRKKSKFRFLFSTNRDYEEAIVIFSRILKNKPSHVLSYEFRGIAKNALKDHKGAIKDLNKAVEFNTNNPNASFVFYNRGIVREELSNYKGAIDDYCKVIVIDPTFENAYNNRGLLKERWFDNIEGAYNDYNEAIELNPFFAPAYNNRGRIKNALKDYSGAMNDYDMAIELKPDLVVAFNNRSILKFRLNNFEGAIEDCNTAIAINSEYVAPYFYRANAKFKLYDYEGAVEDYKKTLKINRYYLGARRNLEIALDKLL